jgi:putative glycosyl hydrolase-like family 15 (GHL15) protein
VPNEFGGSAWSPPLPDLDIPFERAWSKKLERWLPYVQAHVGKPVVANVGSWVTTRDVTDYSHVAGVMIEGFGAGYAPGDWLLQQRRAWSLARRGRIVIAQSYPSGVGDRTFDVASYLLVQGPQSYFDIQTSMEPEWWPEYDVDLGAPTGTAHYGDVAWRDFARGRVFVNPGDASETVAYAGRLVVAHGGGLLPPDGTTDAALSTEPVSPVVLPPRSAAIVYR